eukprot:gene9913-7780_t
MASAHASIDRMFAEAEGTILAGVTAFLVKWRADGDLNFYGPLSTKLAQLGARLVTRLGKDVTHIIFQKIAMPNLSQKAAEEEKLRELHEKIAKASFSACVVSPLWVQASLESGFKEKVQDYVFEKPVDPLWLCLPGPSAEKKQKAARRKSVTNMRPKYRVNIDATAAIFSSSQQIRDLSSEPGGAKPTVDQPKQGKSRVAACSNAAKRDKVTAVKLTSAPVLLGSKLPQQMPQPDLRPQPPVAHSAGAQPSQGTQGTQAVPPLMQRLASALAAAPKASSRTPPGSSRTPKSRTSGVGIGEGPRQAASGPALDGSGSNAPEAASASHELRPGTVVKLVASAKSTPKRTPGALKSTPGALNITPGASKITPGAPNITPGAMKSIPEASKSTPGALKSTPGALKSTPGALKTTPSVNANSPGGKAHGGKRTPSPLYEPGSARETDQAQCQHIQSSPIWIDNNSPPTLKKSRSQVHGGILHVPPSIDAPHVPTGQASAMQVDFTFADVSNQPQLVAAKANTKGRNVVWAEDLTPPASPKPAQASLGTDPRRSVGGGRVAMSASQKGGTGDPTEVRLPKGFTPSVTLSATPAHSNSTTPQGSARNTPRPCDRETPALVGDTPTLLRQVATKAAQLAAGREGEKAAQAASYGTPLTGNPGGKRSQANSRRSSMATPTLLSVGAAKLTAPKLRATISGSATPAGSNEATPSRSGSAPSSQATGTTPPSQPLSTSTPADTPPAAQATPMLLSRGATKLMVPKLRSTISASGTPAGSNQATPSRSGSAPLSQATGTTPPTQLLSTSTLACSNEATPQATGSAPSSQATGTATPSPPLSTSTPADTPSAAQATPMLLSRGATKLMVPKLRSTISASVTPAGSNEAMPQATVAQATTALLSGTPSAQATPNPWPVGGQLSQGPTPSSGPDPLSLAPTQWDCLSLASMATTPGIGSGPTSLGVTPTFWGGLSTTSPSLSLTSAISLRGLAAASCKSTPVLGGGLSTYSLLNEVSAPSPSISLTPARFLRGLAAASGKSTPSLTVQQVPERSNNPTPVKALAVQLSSKRARTATPVKALTIQQVPERAKTPTPVKALAVQYIPVEAQTSTPVKALAVQQVPKRARTPTPVKALAAQYVPEVAKTPTPVKALAVPRRSGRTPGREAVERVVLEVSPSHDGGSPVVGPSHNVTNPVAGPSQDGGSPVACPSHNDSSPVAGPSGSKQRDENHQSAVRTTPWGGEESTSRVTVGATPTDVEEPASIRGVGTAPSVSVGATSMGGEGTSPVAAKVVAPRRTTRPHDGVPIPSVQCDGTPRRSTRPDEERIPSIQCDGTPRRSTRQHNGAPIPSVQCNGTPSRSTRPDEEPLPSVQCDGATIASVQGDGTPRRSTRQRDGAPLSSVQCDGTPRRSTRPDEEPLPSVQCDGTPRRSTRQRDGAPLSSVQCDGTPRRSTRLTSCVPSPGPTMQTSAVLLTTSIPTAGPPAGSKPSQGQAVTPSSVPRTSQLPDASLVGAPLTTPKHYTRVQRHKYNDMGIDLEPLPRGEGIVMEADGTITVTSSMRQWQGEAGQASQSEAESQQPVGGVSQQAEQQQSVSGNSQRNHVCSTRPAPMGALGPIQDAPELENEEGLEEGSGDSQDVAPIVAAQIHAAPIPSALHDGAPDPAGQCGGAPIPAVQCDGVHVSAAKCVAVHNAAAQCTDRRTGKAGNSMEGVEACKEDRRASSPQLVEQSASPSCSEPKSLRQGAGQPCPQPSASGPQPSGSETSSIQLVSESMGAPAARSGSTAAGGRRALKRPAPSEPSLLEGDELAQTASLSTGKGDRLAEDARPSKQGRTAAAAKRTSAPKAAKASGAAPISGPRNKRQKTTASETRTASLGARKGGTKVPAPTGGLAPAGGEVGDTTSMQTGQTGSYISLAGSYISQAGSYISQASKGLKQRAITSFFSKPVTGGTTGGAQDKGLGVEAAVTKPKGLGAEAAATKPGGGLPCEKDSGMVSERLANLSKPEELASQPKRKMLAYTSVDKKILPKIQEAIKALPNSKMCAEGYEEGRVTHLVMGSDRRTLKVLIAIANGAYLVKPEWLIQSHAAGQWLDEEEFFPKTRLTKVADEPREPKNQRTHFTQFYNPNKESSLMCFGHTHAGSPKWQMSQRSLKTSMHVSLKLTILIRSLVCFGHTHAGSPKWQMRQRSLKTSMHVSLKLTILIRNLVYFGHTHAGSPKWQMSQRSLKTSMHVSLKLTILIRSLVCFGHTHAGSPKWQMRQRSLKTSMHVSLKLTILIRNLVYFGHIMQASPKWQMSQRSLKTSMHVSLKLTILIRSLVYFGHTHAGSPKWQMSQRSLKTSMHVSLKLTILIRSLVYFGPHSCRLTQVADESKEP